MELWHWQLQVRAIFDSKASRQGSAITLDRVHLICANIFVGAKHFGSKSLVLTNKLSAEMLRPSCQ